MNWDTWNHKQKRNKLTLILQHFQFIINFWKKIHKIQKCTEVTTIDDKNKLRKQKYLIFDNNFKIRFNLKKSTMKNIVQELNYFFFTNKSFVKIDQTVIRKLDVLVWVHASGSTEMEDKIDQLIPNLVYYQHFCQKD